VAVAMVPSRTPPRRRAPALVQRRFAQLFPSWELLVPASRLIIQLAAAGEDANAEAEAEEAIKQLNLRDVY
jgi:hypothetical protein